MEEFGSFKERKEGLAPYLSPLGAWALAFGCAVGWGAFVMPGNVFLLKAGPLGTSVGMAVGALIMLLIGVNYHFMMNRFPDAGGAFAFTKNVLGYDQGFLNAWFLVLAYISVLWANATALALLGRRLMGDTLQFGFHYSMAGYDVYLGEILAVVAAIVLCALIAMRGGRFAERVQILLALVLFVGVAVGGFLVYKNSGGEVSHYYPLYAPGKTPFMGTMAIVMLAPWAYVGFESISHSAEEFTFSRKRSFGILAVAVVTAAVTYITLSLMAVSVLPEGWYVTWVMYIKDLAFLDGIKGLPTFYAAYATMGDAGFKLIGATVLGGIFTGILGNYIASSRLLYAMARDRMLPDWFGELNEYRVPRNAILFIMAVSVFVPFLGRTAIGWIVDVTTIGAVVVYGYTSYTAFLEARKEGNLFVTVTGFLGCICAVLFALFLFLPIEDVTAGLEVESYVIFIFWSIIGCLFFLYLLENDRDDRFGKTTTGWMWMTALIIITSMVWVQEAFHTVTSSTIIRINDYHELLMKKYHVARTIDETLSTSYFLNNQMGLIRSELLKDTGLQLILILIVLAIMTLVYRTILRREKTTEQEKLLAELSSRAKSNFLSNMSHDIRTPMNAIVGYTALAKKEKDPKKVADYMNKIDASSHHLLALINDVLDMGRVESGKMELELAPANLVKTLDEVRDLFATQMKTKKLVFTVTADVTNRTAICDKNRLNRILLNLLSNAFKFTPEGGSVSVKLIQTGAGEDMGYYQLRVKDTGIGMSPEFAATMFDAFTRERTAEVDGIQGTGLGMAITKSIVDLMGGKIDVITEKKKGTEFVIHLAFPLAEELPEEGEIQESGAAETDSGFAGMRILLVEDNAINREIAQMILMELGFKVETAEDGKIALDKVAASAPGYYDGVLMDIQMPVMNGYESTKAIRSLADKKLAAVPIIAMTANAFAEDVQTARDVGMNGHIAKPINIPDMVATLRGCLK